MPREQVLYSIYKLSTDFICSRNLDVGAYTLKDATLDGNVISVGDNILFERIRNYKGDTRSPDEIFKRVSHLQSALKKAKIRGDEKEAHIIKTFLIKNTFVSEIVNVESCSKTQFRKVAKAGFYMNGCRYVTLTAGAGQLRRETVTFIREDLFEPMYTLLNCDIENRVSEINIAKYSAYFALTSSSIMWVDTPRCCVIKDFFTVIPKQKVDWICKDENGEGYVEERLMDVELNSCDGQGLVSPEFARHWASNMKLDYCPSQFVARSAYIKGDFVVFDFHEYARRNGVTEITDTYGHTYNIDDIDCLVSESQFKMYKYYSSWEDYCQIVQKNGIRWGIARYNKKEDPEWSQTNYQFIQLLTLDNDKIKQLVAPTVDWIDKICSGDTLAALLYCFGGFPTEKKINYDEIYGRAQSLATKAVVKNPAFLKDSYVQHKIYRNIVEAINRAKIGKIWVRGNYQFAVSDPIAQCQSALGLTVKGAIPADCVYSNFWNNLDVKGDIMIGRNPCIDEHELNPCTLYRDEDTDYWYQYLQSGIVFSIYDTSVCRMEDSDFDGDIVASIYNPLFIDKAKKERTNIIMYDKVKAPTHKINHRSIVDGYIRGFGSKVGVYSNHATVIEATKAMFTKPEQERQRKELERRKKLLREIVGAEIDSTKGLAKPKEPWYFTKFVTVDPDDTDVEKTEKYIHNSLVISKKPYFFRYLYPELNKKYKQYENAYNEKSKALFGIKLKKLLAKKDKTEEEKTLVRRYHKFSPVISSNCTMNVLCRQFENIDFDIQWDKTECNMLPYYDLSTFEIDAEKLTKIKELYRRWNNKKAINFLEDVYDDSDPDELKEVRFGALDSLRAELQEEFWALGLTPMEGLTYIKALSLEYTKFNFAFAWEILDDMILECIEQTNTFVPVESEDGMDMFGKKYKLRLVTKEELESPTILVDQETGEVTEVPVHDNF